MERWYGRLVRSTADVLTTDVALFSPPPPPPPFTTPPTTDDANGTRRRSAVLSRSVRSVLSGGRNILFLSNVLHLFPASPPPSSNGVTADHADLCRTTLQSLSAVLLSDAQGTGRTLSVLCGLAANGEDVGKLLASLAHGHGVAEGGGVSIVVEEQDVDGDGEDVDMGVGEEEGPTVVVTDDRRRGVGEVGVERTARVKRRAVVRRQDLQTVSKLDRAYRVAVGGVRREVLVSLQRRMTVGGGSDVMSTVGGGLTVACIVPLLGRIAMDVGGGDLLLRLGTVVFRKGIGREQLRPGSPLSLARDAYVRVLSDVLQCCTGTKSKTSAMSPLMTYLAFHSELLDELWLYAKERLRPSYSASPTNGRQRRYDEPSPTESTRTTTADGYTAMLVFSDLFSQRLLALDDEEFLSSYTSTTTTTSTSGSGRPPTTESAIHAPELIVTMRDILYDLYWNRPVLADDIALPSQRHDTTPSSHHNQSTARTAGENPDSERCRRVRLLLSGTKLWNALYERWSRLFRSAKFCGEECWLFPPLVTRNRDDDGAVTESRAALGEDEDLDMDVDEEEEEEVPMELEDGDGGGRGRAVVASSTATARAMAVEEENDALASSFRDPKMARILTSIPQSLPFDRRVKLFNSIRRADIARTQDESAALRDMMINMQAGNDDADFMGRERVVIRRDAMYEDAKKHLNRLGKRLRKRVQVTFVNKHGANEAGIDGGGVFKEFLDDLIKDAFNPEAKRGTCDGASHPLFTVSPVQTLRVNTAIRPTRDVLSHYEFLGRVLGKAVYESILVEPQFCLPFLNQLLGKQNSLDDLKNIDPEYYRQLGAVRRMEDHVVDSMGLSFELTVRRNDGANETVELVPNGTHIPVTANNAIRYVHLVALWNLNVETAVQTHAFLRGFRDLVPAAWVRLFSPYELQKLIGGDDEVKGFDVTGLKAIMQYGGGYHPSQCVMQWFWEVVEEMSNEQQRKLLKFVTSCSRQPLLGFSSLSPRPCIQQVRLPDAELLEHGSDARLPTSSTCMNLLKLPNYRTKETLRKKLVYAVEAGAGFELS